MKVYDEEVKVVFPWEMTFLFELSDNECHLKHTGVCSLERQSPYRLADIGQDCDYDHCREILNSLTTEGQLHKVEIIKYRCGHFGFNDGQHRVCIAKKQKIKLQSILTTLYFEDCKACIGGIPSFAELR